MRLFLSEICNEILFVKVIMEFSGEEVVDPITIYSDYVGAIYLLYKEKISRILKHVGRRTHFIRSYVENGMMKIIFARSEDNDSNVFTKNTSENTYNIHIR